MEKEGKELKERWKELRNELSFEQRVVWDTLSPQEREETQKFAEEYKKFLNKAKTEREAVAEIVNLAEKEGYVSLEELMDRGKKLKPGNKVYAVNRDKNVALIVIGKEPVWKSLNLIGSHLDAPRLDLKPVPLYEDQGIAFLKTHYYGGIKKYQWVSHPLAIHGVVIRQTGEKINIQIGEAENDPVFVITDLLPHLAKEQLKKKLGEAVTGEALNILAGTLPFEEKKARERVKLAVLELLQLKYGIKEEDLISAELELVPAARARDVGLDRSMVGAYGQDDRICAFTSMKALLECQNPVHTALAVFVDKEEIGSTGNTGMRARFLENTVAELLYLITGDYDEIYCRKALANAKALSADVSAGIDPGWEGTHDKYNAARLGNGVVVTKYTGTAGKYSTSDANAEFVAEVRRIFNDNKIVWQTGELGKVDQGGGGTIAQFMAHYGMNVLDCGPPLLSMHAPVEISHKADIYMCYEAYKAFFKS
ncbi:aminopeptidase [Phosphitispora fastidiosa]|uniref:aminopeptidase n=1 Tax=Phosphitispora fastidiosa TaxID=2837202 RepID=UPI001E5815F8|nr:aminopeptidase [Phosphitispora fastidiosa]MBU7007531.1 aspartyl aminopeptidase [Phosphitispora fastidiosa]